MHADAVAVRGEHLTVTVIGGLVDARLVFQDVLVDHLVKQHVFDELFSASAATVHLRVRPI
jgi:hypothetical protein